MYAIRNFLNGNDNWYNFEKINIYFYPIFANIVTCEKKILDIYIFFYHLLVGYMYRKFKAKRSEICMLLYRYSSVLFTRCICMQFGWGVQCKSSYCVSSSDISLVIYKTCKLLHYGYHQSYTVYNKYGSIIFTMHEQLNDSIFFFWNDIFYFDSMTTLTLINNCVFQRNHNQI